LNYTRAVSELSVTCGGLPSIRTRTAQRA